MEDIIKDAGATFVLSLQESKSRAFASKKAQ